MAAVAYIFVAEMHITSQTMPNLVQAAEVSQKYEVTKFRRSLDHILKECHVEVFRTLKIFWITKSENFG